MEESANGLDLILDLGEGMKLYMADLNVLREQDVNARILPTEEHNTMTNNIRRRGKLESVPYCAMVDGRVEIISGHHRIRAAREAGVLQSPILVDESGLSRSEVIAKQLAHNRLSGYDDPEVLRILYDAIDDPSLQLSTGLASEMTDLPAFDWDASLTPRLDMDWKTITFAFLPHQLQEFETLLQCLPPSDLVGVADVRNFDAFVEAARRYGAIERHPRHRGDYRPPYADGIGRNRPGRVSSRRQE